MEDALTQWLLENRPYTHLHTRVKQFIRTCQTLQPELSYGALKRTIVPLVDKLLQGDLGWR